MLFEFLWLLIKLFLVCFFAVRPVEPNCSHYVCFQQLQSLVFTLLRLGNEVTKDVKTECCLFIFLKHQTLLGYSQYDSMQAHLKS